MAGLPVYLSLGRLLLLSRGLRSPSSLAAPWSSTGVSAGGRRLLSSSSVLQKSKKENDDGSSSSSSDEEAAAKKPPMPKVSPQDAKDKLNQLLLSMKEKKKKIADEAPKAAKVKEIPKDEPGDDGIKLAKPRETSRKDRKSLNIKGLDPELASAASKVGQHLGGDDPRAVRKAESDLLRQLRSVAKESLIAQEDGAAEQGTTRKSLYESLKVESSPEEKRISPSSSSFERQPLSNEQEAFLEKRRRMRRDRRDHDHGGARETRGELARVDLGGGTPLGIFTAKVEGERVDDGVVRLETWEKCRERELRILSTPVPRNFMEEMIQMTERGMLWHFPVNNEQGIDESEMEPFHAHVFLEHHLEPWCPKKGPVRHFMELVCVGLQQNPHISVERKLGHIEWFKSYFEEEDRQEILKLSGAIET